MSVVDHGAALLQGMQVVPDLGAIQARNQQVEAQRQAIALRTQQYQREIAQQQQQEQRQAAWQARMGEITRDPNPRALQQALLEFPEMRESITAAYGNPNDERAQGDLRQMASIYARVRAGDHAGAADMIERRLASEAENGIPPDEEDVEMARALRSGDPAEINRASAMLGVVIAALPGADDFFGNLDKANPQAERTQTWKSGQDAYDDAIRRGATPEQAEARRNRVIDALERNAIDPVITGTPGGTIGRQSQYVGQEEGGGQASGGEGGQSRQATLDAARDAIRRGAAPAAVEARLQSMGITGADLTADMARGGTITPTQARTILQSMGGDQSRFAAWRRQNNVRVSQ